ncbi:uncharacterized protein LOC111693179 [Anoplophora glabripennis]|uniref:uncharacterized protein LOC111693179 n=1 Tax=Anoplophora glabripennis TaxID=217634 RepID=UPI000C7917FB|nr:uncharacterized protein LOC111693179 [Anoplophora glabripennis]
MFIANPRRMEKHLSVCSKAPAEIKRLFSQENRSFQNKENQIPTADTQSIKSSNSSILNFCDHISDKESLQLNTLLARAIYATCSPLSLVENKYFKTFLKTIRPSYSPPSRYQISTGLLDKEHNLIQEKIGEKLSKANSLILLSDSWTDINGISLINIVFSTPEPIFYKTIDSKTESHTGQYIADVLSKAIEEVGSQKVDAVVTDNARNMKLAWSLLKEKHPHLVTYGCIAHGINLLLKDLYSLPSVSKCTASIKDIIKFFKNKHMAKQVLKEIHLTDNGNKEIALITYVETRWGSMVQSFVSVLKNKDFLQKAVLHKYIRPIVDARIRRYILDEDEFWPKVKFITEFTKPIADVIKALEGDTSLLSKVYSHIKVLDDLFCDKLDFLNNVEIIKAKEIFEHRKSFIFHPVQLAAYLLDPKEIGNRMTEDDMNIALNFIAEFASIRNYDMDKILSDLANYKARAGPFSNSNIWRAANSTNPTIWWKGFFQNYELSKVATRILNFPPTSASCERNWKTYSLTKTKKRNRLTIERTNKLITVKYNLQLLNDEDFQQTDLLTGKETEVKSDEEIAMGESTASEDSDLIIYDETDDEQIDDINGEDSIDEEMAEEIDLENECIEEFDIENNQRTFSENNEQGLEEANEKTIDEDDQNMDMVNELNIISGQNEEDPVIGTDTNEQDRIMYVPGKFFVLGRLTTEKDQ